LIKNGYKMLMTVKESANHMLMWS